MSLYEKRSVSLKKLKDTLRAIFGSERPQAFVFVDELDRCRPDYAISYLETIKHVFDIHGLVFVLAVDYDQLSCSARALFGRDLNFEEYYRKFVQRSLSLPEPDSGAMRKLAEHYTARFLNLAGKRENATNLHTTLKYIVDLVVALRMTPRQIQEAFRILGHATAKSPRLTGQMFWCASAMATFLVCLKVAKRDLYQRIGTGKVSDLELGQFLNALNISNPNRWFVIYVTGRYEAEAINVLELGRTMKDLGYLPQGNELNPSVAFREYFDGWDYADDDRVRKTFVLIETAATFG